MKITDIKINPNNPRIIKDEKFQCLNCKIYFYSKKACKSRTPKYCSKNCYAKREITQDWIKKISDARKGKNPHNKLPTIISKCAFCCGDIIVRIGARYVAKFCSIKCRNNDYKTRDVSDRTGVNSHFWRGGVTSENDIARRCSKYKDWRKSVFERDNFTCVLCFKKGGCLNADHILPFSLFKELRYDINNGRTLCVECHRKTDTFGFKAINYATTIS